MCCPVVHVLKEMGAFKTSARERSGILYQYFFRFLVNTKSHALKPPLDINIMFSQVPPLAHHCFRTLYIAKEEEYMRSQAYK